MTGKRQKRTFTDLVVHGNKITDNKQKAKVLGQHFAEVSSNDNLEEPLSSIKKLWNTESKRKLNR